MKNKKGITLIALIITVVILSILASVATYTGINAINLSKLTAFSAELKIMQTQVNSIYQEKDEDTVYGEEITGDIKTQADRVFNIKESGIVSQEGYRYWSNAMIKNLGIEGVEQSFFVNLQTRSVVSYQGLKQDGRAYYTLEQLPDGLYNVEYRNSNTGKPTFDVNVESVGANKWKITISNIEYSGYIKKWEVYYQMENQDHWNTTEDVSFVVDKIGNYKVQLVNGDVISAEKTVTVGE